MTASQAVLAQPDRDRVLEAAERLFYERGIQSVGMDAVRTASGVPLKRLYACFPSKNALIVEVLGRRREQWNTRLAAAMGARETPGAKLLAVYDFLDEWFRGGDFHGCAFINAFGELGGVSPEVGEIVRAQKAEFQQQVAELVRSLGGPDALAAQLALLAEGAQTTAAIEGRPDAARAARDAAEILISAAMGSEERQPRR